MTFVITCSPMERQMRSVLILAAVTFGVQWAMIANGLVDGFGIGG